jgi:hypothetical protein
MGGFLPPESGGPFAHVEAGLVDAGLVVEGSLERLLPVVLKFSDAGLHAAALIAHPAEGLAEELADIGDAVVV